MSSQHWCCRCQVFRCLADPHCAGAAHVFVVLSYISIWVGFGLWCVMGTYWASIDIGASATTHFGQYQVCDRWESSSEQTIFVMRDVIKQQRADVIATTALLDERLTDDTWPKCTHTSDFIAPYSGKVKCSHFNNNRINEDPFPSRLQIECRVVCWRRGRASYSCRQRGSCTWACPVCFCAASNTSATAARVVASWSS